MTELDLTPIKDRLEAVQGTNYEKGRAPEEAWSALYQHAPADITALTAEVERLRQNHQAFMEALDYGEPETGLYPELDEIVGPLRAEMQLARDHQECPGWCPLCGEKLAATRCEQCGGAGGGPGPNLTFSECEWCGGDGYVHEGCAEESYEGLAQEVASLLARLDAVKEVSSKHWDAMLRREAKFGRTGSACICEICKIMRVLEGGEQG